MTTGEEVDKVRVRETKTSQLLLRCHEIPAGGMGEAWNDSYTVDDGPNRHGACALLIFLNEALQQCLRHLLLVVCEI
jgi:hypothetical protein